MSQTFFDYDGITFNRSAIKVISGPTINPAEPDHEPYFHVVLSEGVEWHITATSHTDLIAKHTAFLQVLNS